jgi:hypothetical protein
MDNTIRDGKNAYFFIINTLFSRKIGLLFGYTNTIRLEFNLWLKKKSVELFTFNHSDRHTKKISLCEMHAHLSWFLIKIHQKLITIARSIGNISVLILMRFWRWPFLWVFDDLDETPLGFVIFWRRMDKYCLLTLTRSALFPPPPDRMFFLERLAFQSALPYHPPLVIFLRCGRRHNPPPRSSDFLDRFAFLQETFSFFNTDLAPSPFRNSKYATAWQFG